MNTDASTRRRGWRPLLPVLATSVWVATLGNLVLWQHLRDWGLLEGWRGALFALSLLIGVTALMTTLCAPFIGRRTLKPVLTLWLLIAAGSTYFMQTYNIVIDPAMFTNLVQTDVREVRDLLSPRLLVTLLLLGVLPAVLLWWLPVRHTLSWPRRLGANAGLFVLGLLACVLMILAQFQTMASTVRNHRDMGYRLNPLNTVYAGLWQALPKHSRNTGPLQPLGRDAQLAGPAAPGAKPPPLLVLVVGETGRAGNFALNGYARPTNPELSALPVLSFRQAWSCGTSTAASLPCMFSPLGREGFESRRQDSENLLDVLQHAGLAVLWLDNQSGCKGVCDRVPHAKAADPIPVSDDNPPDAARDPSLCQGDECFDLALLQGLEQRVAALPEAQRQRGVVVVLHQMGSHGPAYSLRSPPAFKRFLPECQNPSLPACSRDEIVNAYDDSIVYTDHLLAQTIHWLERRSTAYDTALFYVADHGESLGENNLYLHGLPYGMAPDVQKHVPWINWFEPRFAQRNGLDLSCLRGRLDQPISHDNLFHSVLGLLDVQTSVYDKARDAYAPCRNRLELNKPY